MKVTIEIDSKNELDKLSALFKTFNINAISVTSSDNTIIPLIKGDKKINPNDLFGIWAKKPRLLESIRKDAWKRNS